MFKQIQLLATLFCFTFSATAMTASPGPAFPTDGCLETATTLRAGTSITLQLNEEITSDAIDIGNTVDLRVRGNVIVNGRVVIADGAMAEGEVYRIVKDCDQCVQSISIRVSSVMAVDGQRISLQGTPYKKSARCKGCSAVINPGTNLRATVLNDTDINA